MIKRIIPSSGEELPVIGLGTWKTFDVSIDKYPELKNVLNELHIGGARLIDSSSMYGKSEQVIGDIICGPQVVIEYLGRYMNKVAISNHRIEGNTYRGSYAGAVWY